MLESCDLIAFAASTELARACDFYQQTLGLRLVEQNDYACVFDANGVMLRVTAAAQVAHPGYTVLGWRMPDIGAAVRGLVERGVVFTRYDAMEQDADGVWTTPGGDLVAWFTDPEGNTLSLTQFGPGPQVEVVPVSRR